MGPSAWEVNLTNFRVVPCVSWLGFSDQPCWGCSGLGLRSSFACPFGERALPGDCATWGWLGVDLTDADAFDDGEVFLEADEEEEGMEAPADGEGRA